MSDDDGDDDGILGRIRREAQAEDDRLPRYHEDRPGRLPNNRPFTCPRCGRTSHNPTDAQEGYCGACHDWTGL
jgi:hypothetical protein